MHVDFTIKRIVLEDCVMGVLEVTDNDFRCTTLERPWLNNTTWVSCIPPGTYDYFYRDDGQNGKVLELVGVVNRGNIQLHIGNWVKDSVGCILVGQDFRLIGSNEPMIANSGKTMTAFLNSVPPKGVMTIY